MILVAPSRRLLRRIFYSVGGLISQLIPFLTLLRFLSASLFWLKVLHPPPTPYTKHPQLRVSRIFFSSLSSFSLRV